MGRLSREERRICRTRPWMWVTRCLSSNLVLTRQGWKGLWCEDAGWVAARDALRAVGKELESLGVESSYADSGTFESLLLGPDGRTVRGVRTADGTEWEGSEVIMATGAWSPVLLDLEGQCTSKVITGFLVSYGHVLMSRGGLLRTCSSHPRKRWHSEIPRPCIARST